MGPCQLCTRSCTKPFFCLNIKQTEKVLSKISSGFLYHIDFFSSLSEKFNWGNIEVNFILVLNVVMDKYLLGVDIYISSIYRLYHLYHIYHWYIIRPITNICKCFLFDEKAASIQKKEPTRLLHYITLYLNKRQHI